MERIDSAAVAARGVPVANLPDVNAPFVAEQAIALLRPLMHRSPEASAGVEPGRWGSPAGRSLAKREACVTCPRAVAERVAPIGIRLTSECRPRWMPQRYGRDAPAPLRQARRTTRPSWRQPSNAPPPDSRLPMS